MTKTNTNRTSSDHRKAIKIIKHSPNNQQHETNESLKNHHGCWTFPPEVSRISQTQDAGHDQRAVALGARGATDEELGELEGDGPRVARGREPACVQIKSSTRLQCERIRMF